MTINVLCPKCCKPLQGGEADEALGHLGEFDGRFTHGVTQVQVGMPRGECVRASYASLLGLALDAVPRFDPEVTRALKVPQPIHERNWLRDVGLCVIELECDAGQDLPEALLGRLPRVFHLVSGTSERGFQHRCVGFGGKLAWDPHPSRSGLLNVSSVGFLAPRCPACEAMCDAGHRR